MIPRKPNPLGLFLPFPVTLIILDLEGVDFHFVCSEI